LLTNALAASEASRKMLDTLLDFSRIEAGVIKPQVQTFRLQPLLNKMENELAMQADEKGIVYRTRETSLAVQSDPALVELILRNLVSNAIRYTERGGVLVACRRRGSQAVLEVWDTGIGIPRDQQQEVFREFHQLGNPEQDIRKGLGLGLAIAQGLANTLGHQLSLASTPGRGSVFRLTLSAAAAPAPEEQGAQVQRKKKLLNAHILVIDDDKAVLAGMRYLMQEWGCQCDVAESIEEAVRLAHAHAPDVIISDYRLRESCSGVDAIFALRTSLGRNLPALLVTGDTAPERLREAQASGIPLLHKPLSPSQLYLGLAGVLGDEK
jgi:CheY-like chemotaxis protein